MTGYKVQKSEVINYTRLPDITLRDPLLGPSSRQHTLIGRLTAKYLPWTFRLSSSAQRSPSRILILLLEWLRIAS